MGRLFSNICKETLVGSNQYQLWSRTSSINMPWSQRLFQDQQKLPRSWFRTLLISATRSASQRSCSFVLTWFGPMSLRSCRGSTALMTSTCLTKFKYNARWLKRYIHLERRRCYLLCPCSASSGPPWLHPSWQMTDGRSVTEDGGVLHQRNG